jgi:hypothetical protein
MHANYREETRKYRGCLEDRGIDGKIIVKCGSYRNSSCVCVLDSYDPV